MTAPAPRQYRPAIRDPRARERDDAATVLARCAIWFAIVVLTGQVLRTVWADPLGRTVLCATVGFFAFSLALALFLGACIRQGGKR